MRLTLTIFFWTLLSSLFSQSIQPFANTDLMAMGVYYYPEHWPEKQWNRDLGNIAKMGFEFTHFGEFAWAFMEPKEGQYDFAWLDKAIKLADSHGLKVVLCTPSATPPAWLTQKYPEVLVENKEGRKLQHGTRQHVSWSSPTYRRLVQKIVQQLAQRYGKDERVIGWQLDNEPSHYGVAYDYSAPAQDNFRNWLRQKYLSIDELNKAWGTRFWSQIYQDFSQIRIPNEAELVQFINPHAILDFKRFQAGEVAEFLSLQAKMLRDHISSTQWITTNFMRFHEPVDPALSEDLDFISWTSYPVSGYNDGIGKEGYRRGVPADLGFGNDYFRPLSGTTGIMELQIGQVCWGDYSPRLGPGTQRMFLYHILAGGNKFSCSYRYRQPTFNYEQNIVGMVGTDGVTPTDGGQAYMQFIKELKDLREKINPEAKSPEDYEARRTAILWNPDNLWITNYQKQTQQWDYMAHQQGYYNALKAMGCPVDYISESEDFSKYPVMIAPAYELVDAALIDRWRTYVKEGGHLILTTRTGTKDRNGHYWEAKRAEPIWDLIGAEISFYDNLPENHQASVNFGGLAFKWNNWGEGLNLQSGTAAMAFYADQFYTGAPAVSSRKIGRGTVTYIGVDTDSKDFELAILRKVYSKADIPTASYGKGVVVEWRDGLWIGVNYSGESQRVQPPPRAKILHGSPELAPSEVIVWIEEEKEDGQ